jgi:predicted nucleotidyltransferase
LKADSGLKPSDLRAICNVLSAFPEVNRAYLFGSRSKGNFKAGSDVDIALTGEHLSLRTVSDIGFQLNEESLMPYHFDVLDFNTVSEPDLRSHIQRKGILIYEKT